MPKKPKSAFQAPRTKMKKASAGDTLNPLTAFASEIVPALQARTRETIPLIKDARGEIDGLIAALSIRQRELAKELATDPEVRSSDDVNEKRVSLALERVAALMAQELRELTPPEQHLLLSLLSSGMSRVSPSPEKFTLPDAAPEDWEKRKTGLENPAQFVRRVYANWIGNGLTRAHVRQLDMPLYRALAAWMSRHPEDDFADLPSLSESIDHKVARLSAEFTPDELRKLGLALQNRSRRS